MKQRNIKSHCGNLFSLLVPMISTMVILIITHITLSIVDALFLKDEVNQVCRNTMLQMETVGYLDTNTMLEAQVRLQELGIDDISFSGSTLYEVSYGDEIRLELTASMPMVEMVGDSNIFSVMWKDSSLAFREVRVSTGKH
ncbi:MAG: hypothetical protein R3Y47_09650 [Lachnospiraceae bacterium]